MVKQIDRASARLKRHQRIRNHVNGTSERPRLAVFRSNKHIYCQIIDDVKKVTLVAASTVEKAIADTLEKTWDVDAATAVGKAIAEKAQAAGIKAVVFDRGGYIYHGKVKALGDAAREAGLEF